MSKPQRKKQASIEAKLSLLAFVANIVPSILLILCLWVFKVSNNLIGVIIFFLSLLTLYSVGSVWQKTQFHFRSLHNLLDALVQGDYSFRGQSRSSGGAFGDLISTINSLASTLQKQRLQSEESQLLLRKVVDQIDVAIITWDQINEIQLINPAAQTLLGLSERDKDIGGIPNSTWGELPSSLAFANEIETGETQVQDLIFGTNRGKFRLHMERFISEGQTHSLLFLTNVSNILRHEEKKAWQNLIRVLSHEINNSLVPLSSLSNTLMRQIQKREQDPVLAKELLDGMTVITNRSKSLASFVQSYHQISKLPEPNKQPAKLKGLMEGVIKLFPNDNILCKGDSFDVLIDSAQIEQAVINLLKNAVESNQAYSEKNEYGENEIQVIWAVNKGKVLVEIVDTGEGISNQENLFTPFYSTKAKGSGVGLVFCQKIIEAHGGYLSISNRTDTHGCSVKIELPL